MKIKKIYIFILIIVVILILAFKYNKSNKITVTSENSIYEVDIKPDNLENEEISYEDYNMAIRIADFSQETKDVLSLLENKIQFFDYKIDDSIKYISIDLWDCNNYEMKNTGSSIINVDNLKERKIALKIYDNIIDIYSLKEKGYTKYTYGYSLNLKKMKTTMNGFLPFTKVIEPNKPIILYFNIGTKEDTIENNEYILDDFTKVKCDKGLIITATFYDKDRE